MKDSGLYQLLIYLEESTTITIGKLGTFDFKNGFYVYTGSARNGLQARVSRHFSKRKKKHWHIDYFLTKSRIVEVKLYYQTSFNECELNASKIADDAKLLVNKFGASDCKCKSHLIYLGTKKSSQSFTL